MVEGNFPRDASTPSLVRPFLLAWRIDFGQDEFGRWITSLQRHVLFFNSFSEGNPRVAGVKGIIFYLGGNVVLTYTFGMGNATNNHAKRYSLYLGFDQSILLGIQDLVVIGDSLLIIS